MKEDKCRWMLRKVSRKDVSTFHLPSPEQREELVDTMHALNIDSMELLENQAELGVDKSPGLMGSVRTQTKYRRR